MAKRFKKPHIQEKKFSGIGSNKSVSDYDELIKFSFKYLDLTHVKFHFNDREVVYFFKVIERFQKLSQNKVLYLKTNRSSGLRFHGIDWPDTTENNFGIPLEDEIVDQPWQFEISSNEHGRVHGFFIGNVFNVVWFDPKHLLYT
jgi:hypothetical protein